MQRSRITGFMIPLLAMVLALLWAGTSAAEPRHRGGHHGPSPGRFLEENADRLGFDQATREAIHEIVEASRESAEDLRKELGEERRALHELLSEEEPNEKKVMKQADIMGELETERHKHRLSSMIKIRALLTPEQRAELSGLREESREEWHRPMIDACREDIEKFCADADDRWARRQCMREHRDELSEGCHAAIQEMKSGRRERRDGPRPRPRGHGGI